MIKMILLGILYEKNGVINTDLLFLVYRLFTIDRRKLAFISTPFMNVW